jgi:8-oxo-dGTP diphosphatase
VRLQPGVAPILSGLQRGIDLSDDYRSTAMKEFGEKKAGVEYKKRVGSYGVVIENERVGVIKSKDYADYFLTGGGIEEGETETGSLRREAREEIGFEIEIGEKIGQAVEYFYSNAERKYTAKECHFYRLSLVGEADGKGKHELIWITKDDLNRLHYECYRWIVERELNK